MAKKPNITQVTSGFSSTIVLNKNFNELRDGFDNTLSLDGSTPNAMQAELDMGNNSIINAGKIETDGLILNGTLVTPSGLDPIITGISGFGASLIDDTNSAEALTTLGLTATAAELNTLVNTMDGITATTEELNTMDGILATTDELNFSQGVTSNIQIQLDALYEPVTQSLATWEAGVSTLESLVSPYKVKALIDEVGIVAGSGTAQIGTLKMAWGTASVPNGGSASVSLPFSYTSTSTYGVVAIADGGNHPGATTAAQGAAKSSSSSITLAKASFSLPSMHWFTIGY